MLPPCLFTLHADYIMQNVQPDDSQGGIKITRRNINNLRYADDITLMAGKQMSRQVSRGSAGDYQADEQAGVARLSWGVTCR